MNPFSNQLQRRFTKDYSPTSYLDRYAGSYVLLQIMQIVLSAFLATCSFKFWQVLLGRFIHEDYSWGFALATTILISFLIYYLLNIILKSYHAKDDVPPVLIILLVAFVCGDIYANVFGIPELTSEMMPAPVDNKTPEVDALYGEQISAASQERSDLVARKKLIESNKSGLYSPGGATYWKGVPSEFGRKELRSLDARIQNKDTELATLRASMIKDRQRTQDEHAFEMTSHTMKLSQRIAQLRWLQGIVYIVLFVISFGCHGIAAKSARMAMENDTSSPPPSHGKKPFIDPHLTSQHAPHHNGSKQNGHKHPTNHTGIVDMRRPKTSHVTEQTSSVTQHEQGFLYDCEVCDGDRVYKRPLKAGEHAFCSSSCKDQYHREKREKQRKEQAAAV